MTGSEVELPQVHTAEWGVLGQSSQSTFYLDFPRRVAAVMSRATRFHATKSVRIKVFAGSDRDESCTSAGGGFGLSHCARPAAEVKHLRTRCPTCIASTLQRGSHVTLLWRLVPLPIWIEILRKRMKYKWLHFKSFTPT